MIEHEGIVEHINGNHITVRISQQSACSTCHAKSACMAAESKEKRVDVTAADAPQRFSLNERVIVEGKKSIGYKAVLWAFVLPLVILVGVLALGISAWQMSEIQASALAIAALVPYYLVLYFLRNKMAGTFRFTIRKMEDAKSQ